MGLIADIGRVQDFEQQVEVREQRIEEDIDAIQVVRKRWKRDEEFYLALEGRIDRAVQVLQTAGDGREKEKRWKKYAVMDRLSLEQRADVNQVAALLDMEGSKPYVCLQYGKWRYGKKESKGEEGFLWKDTRRHPHWWVAGAGTAVVSGFLYLNAHLPSDAPLEVGGVIVGSEVAFLITTLFTFVAYSRTIANDPLQATIDEMNEKKGVVRAFARKQYALDI